ncbi:MAG: cyclic nucleotide-binding domain-containing protein [Betaproteobacteria bacterium]|nr:cyclic nucleotide-binding domain-containing protein [Betaproteobacteria bacterium]
MNLEDLLPYQTDLKIVPVGHTLFSEGDSGQDMYVLVTGRMDIRIKDTIVESAAPGAIIGEMSLIDGAPRSATAVAREECTLIAIDKMRFRQMTREVPDFALNVMKGMADRLRRLGKLL